MTCLASGDFAPLHSLSYLQVSGGDAISALYRRRLQRLILATPSASYTGEAISVLYWLLYQRLILATPSMSYTGDTLPWRRHVLAMPGAVNLLTLALALTLTLTLVNS